MKKKNIVFLVIVLIAVLLMSFWIGTGFHKRTDVTLIGYSVSEDGTKLKFQTAVPTSMGYIRGFVNKGGGVKPHYLVFYSAFGGWNSSFGAKSEFELNLSEDDNEIYFNRANGGYELVLQKNEETGIWSEV